MLSAATAYDAVVLGLGGMGSAALAHLAARGKRVLGIERFERAHERGSSAGRSRIIRMAYYEDPAYVPLLRRAYELWRELERQSGMTLLDLYGVLMVGGFESSVLRGARLSARMHDIALEELDRADILRRYPTLLVGSSECGILETASRGRISGGSPARRARARRRYPLRDARSCVRAACRRHPGGARRRLDG